jgi:PHD/YefM family antitoxin component YafN of YafNO toxin-antitoxin module
MKEFDKYPAHAQKAAASSPVFIAEKGMHVFVLLTIEEYRRMGGSAERVVSLANPAAAEIDSAP